jgi:hypothetical protein
MFCPLLCQAVLRDGRPQQERGAGERGQMLDCRRAGRLYHLHCQRIRERWQGGRGAEFAGVLTCFTDDYKKVYTVKQEQAFPMNPPHMDGVKDNTELMYLQDASLLHNIRVRSGVKRLTLKVRYSRDEIYTFTAFILIAVNPYKQLPIYGPEIMKQVDIASDCSHSFVSTWANQSGSFRRTSTPSPIARIAP